MGIILNIVRNKKNNQLFVALPRKKLGLDKETQPTSMEINNIKFKILKKKVENMKEDIF